MNNQSAKALFDLTCEAVKNHTKGHTMTEAKATNELRTLAHRLRCKDGPAHVDYISKGDAADWADRLADQYNALYAALKAMAVAFDGRGESSPAERNLARNQATTALLAVVGVGAD